MSHLDNTGEQPNAYIGETTPLRPPLNVVQFTPEDNKIRNLATTIFWYSIIQALFLIIGIAVADAWILLLLVVFLLCGIFGAWKLSRCLLITYMVYQGLIFILSIVVMAIWPETWTIVWSIVQMIIVSIAFGLALRLVMLIPLKSEEEKIWLSQNFRVCCCDC